MRSVRTTKHSKDEACEADWWDAYDRWQRRDLSMRRFVYIWADGVYFRPRMAEEKQCVLVLIGADEWGRKEIIGLADGYREFEPAVRRIVNELERCGTLPTFGRSARTIVIGPEPPSDHHS